MALIDSGSMTSTISRRIVERSKLLMNSSDTIIKTLSNTNQVIGITNNVTVDVQDHKCRLKFYVIESDHDFILGLNWFHAMEAGLVFKDGCPK